MNRADRDRAFQDWRAEALSVGLLEAAETCGARLKRVGVATARGAGEHVGPCPHCGGNDRFSVNESKGVWNCRQSKGGHDAIGLVMHAKDVGFKEACELLTGRPPPTGREEITPEEKERRHKAKLQREQEQRDREAKEARRRENTRDFAHEIWKESRPLPGTAAEIYLRRRGIDFDLSPFKTLRFHPALDYQHEGVHYGRHPALVAAVQAPDDGRFLSIWRIFVTADGHKAPVPKPKLGLANFTHRGGCVRLGPVTPRGNVCEGIETGLGIVGILRRREGVQCALSTSGMDNWLPPAGVTSTLIWPDGDTDKIRPDAKGEERLRRSPGVTTAEKNRARLLALPHPAAVQPIEKTGLDWLDVWNELKRRIPDYGETPA